MAGLTASQRAIVKRIAEIGKEVGATPKEVKAALETGRVESNFSNSAKMTDHDSQGWRQERASLYKDPTNLDASIRRFFNETKAVRDKYGSAGALAAAVQRPAAQYRGRYQQQSAEADKLLDAYYRGKGGSAGSSSPATTTIKTPATTTVKQTSSTAFDQAGYDRAVKLASLKSVLAGFTGGKSTGLLASVLPDTADPAAFTSTKTGLKTVTTPGTTVKVASAKTSSSSGSSSSGSVPGLKGKGSGLFELIYNNGGKGYGVKDKKIVDGKSVFSGVWANHANHVHVAAGPKTTVALGKLAQQMGLHVGENPSFGGENPSAHVPNSYHNKGEAIDVSGDKAKMEAYAKKVRQLYFGK